MPISDGTMLGMANRFTVKIDHGTYDLGSWAQVDGLDVKWDVVEYRAGDVGNERWYFPGNTHYSVLKLTRAASAESAKVREWLDTTSFKYAAQTGNVRLLDAAGAEIMKWDLKQIMPVRWSVAGFEAGASRVATETLELAHRGFLADEMAFPR
ncbi:phage tail protein [Spirilliplanes yamanashiensis]|uniref:Phage tail protein n=1 Tax=Spirilliplanes yamanashiensis TaxID=42233 RepID=A0A8J4DJX2_9ACTN|nr:phage tail protein [Spirilliplanes yamanashiensis]MDP9815433.1 phage tail-like protein [Spirilliplanes yamanashiensis]GIJ03688.1 phage tail protein [Spirilliplanes yamanashiensis]